MPITVINKKNVYSLCTVLAVLLFTAVACAQPGDSARTLLQQVPGEYFTTISSKVDKYSSRVSKKTLKTITKLAKWETKIKNTLQKIDPETASNLFGNNQLTFGTLLQQIQKGEAIQLDYRRQYDRYRDDLSTGIKYLETNKALLDSGIAKNMQAAKEKIRQLNNDEDSTEAISRFIKERKKAIVSAALTHLGKSKWLTKMNKETWYYAETIKNYKEIFNDEAKTEKLVNDVLNKVPGFSKFIQKNSMLSGLFQLPDNYGNDEALYGLQTREDIGQLIQQRISAGGPSGQQLLNQNIQAAHAQLNDFKNKLAKISAGNGGGDLQDFKPNMQKTKTFLQRLEYGSNIQFARNNSLMPATMDMGLSVGYKLNDNSVAGLGASYKMGMGTIDNIKFSTQGIGLRSFIDWKLKKNFFISGGWEINYLSDLKIAPSVRKENEAWQKSALLGISKKINVKTNFFKGTKLQLLYDFLAKQHVPVSQHLLFRIGYTF